MDEEAKAINARAEENSSLETPPSETNAPEVQEESVQPEKTEKSTEETEAEGEKKVSGAEKRIHKLVDERDQARQQAQSLQSKLAELTAGQPAGTSPPYQPAQGESSGGERELTIDDLRTIARLEVEKERTISRINLEASEVLQAHPELDVNSDKFDADINEAVTSAVLLEVQRDPTQSVKKLTEKYLKPYRKVAEKAIGEEKKVLTQQVNDEALRPSTVKPARKSFQEKTLEEMEAELEIVH
jgi:hypothetical protein